MTRPGQELRWAARGLLYHPTFAIAAVATLALGIGANTAVFSVAHGVLAAPLPYPDPSRLVLLTGTSQVSVPDGTDWRERSRSIAEVALFIRKWDFDLTGQGEPQRLTGSVVEPALFHLLGVTPVLGRVLTSADNQSTAPRTVVIGEGLWRRQFGADRSILGRTIVLNDHPTTVVGVVPEAADVLGDGVDLWTPVATETPWALDQRGTNNFDAVARLQPAATIDQSRRELADISSALATAYPATNTGKVVAPLPLLTALVGDVRGSLVLLECAVLLVLGLATVNLAGLLVTRGRVRRHDTAVRLALGARYRQLVAGLTAEGLLLAAMGTALGITFAILGHDALMAVLPASLPRAGGIHVDGSAVAFGAALALGSAMLLVLLPAIDVRRSVAGGGLATADRAGVDRGHHRLLGGLVVTEVALAVVVLVASVLLGRTFLALERVRLGFEPSHVVFGDLVLPESRYSTIAPQSAAFRGAVQHLSATPGVEAAGSVIGLPLGAGGTIGHRLEVEGQPPVAPGSEASAEDRPVTGDYFGALRIPIVRGRAFTDADDERAAPVAIVNETLARRTWLTASPLGHRVRWVGAGDSASWMTVVGVAGDVKALALTTGDQPAVYVPYVQRAETWQRFGTLVVRGSDPVQLERAIRAAVREVDPLVPVGRVAPMLTVRSRAMAQQRFDAIVLGVFSAAALVLAIQGIYGTLAYVVEQRRREIGIRMALGATPRTVRRAVVNRGLRLTVVGVVVGLVAAAAVGRVVRGLLYGVTAGDPTTYVVVSLAIAGAGWLGAFVPARRASRADPLVALRGSS